MARAVERPIDVQSEAVQEFRIVCGAAGEVGHHEHVWVKKKPSLIERFREKLTRDVTGRKQAPVELPYKTQTRMVSPWEDYEYNKVELP